MDFAWEVSRSLAACQGAILLVGTGFAHSLSLYIRFTGGCKPGSSGPVNISLSQRKGKRVKDYPCLE